MASPVGIDIGTTSIKLIQLDGKSVRKIAMVANPYGKELTKMNNVERVGVVEILDNLFKEQEIKSGQIVMSVSESLVYSRVMKFPFMSSPELATAIKWELDQSVPFPPAEMEMSWTIMEKPNKAGPDSKIETYVVALPAKVSEAYVSVCENLNLELIRLENEISALSRSYDSLLGDDVGLIIDIGNLGTSMALVNKMRIFSSFYLPIGGASMTKVIADSFGLPVGQAEGYKRTYGMDKNQFDGKLFNALRPLVDMMLGEARKIMLSHQDEYKDQQIHKIILSGGGSYLNGLISYLSQQIDGVEIYVGDVFTDYAVADSYKPLAPVFAVALGLVVE